MIGKRVFLANLFQSAPAIMKKRQGEELMSEMRYMQRKLVNYGKMCYYQSNSIRLVRLRDLGEEQERARIRDPELTNRSIHAVIPSMHNPTSKEVKEYLHGYEHPFSLISRLELGGNDNSRRRMVLLKSYTSEQLVDSIVEYLHSQIVSCVILI